MRKIHLLMLVILNSLFNNQKCIRKITSHVNGSDDEFQIDCSYIKNLFYYPTDNSTENFVERLNLTHSKIKKEINIKNCSVCVSSFFYKKNILKKFINTG